jgi:hypothetical protein
LALDNKVWPEYFGIATYQKIRSGMLGMCSAESRTAFDSAYGTVRVIFANDPLQLQYVTETFYDHPERFARFVINLVDGSLNLCGSQPSEQNHSGVCAYLGTGCAQPLHDQIGKLFTRKREQVAQKETNRRIYQLDCMATANKKIMTVDDKEALLTLSKHAYNEIWCKMRNEAKNYSCTGEPNEVQAVQRNGQHPESARLIPPGERCPCPDRVALLAQCVHECCAAQGRFVKKLWNMRHWQPDALLAHAVGSPSYCGSTSTATKRKVSIATAFMTGKKKSKSGGCGFCGQTGHNMKGCRAKLEHGKHLTNSQLNELLIGDLVRASRATALSQGIVTNNAPILQSLPKTSMSQ